MTNPDAGHKIIRKLPDRPLIGERYSNAGSVYEVLSLNTEGDKAKVRRPKDGWCALPMARPCTRCRAAALNCSGTTAPMGIGMNKAETPHAGVSL